MPDDEHPAAATYEHVIESPRLRKSLPQGGFMAYPPDPVEIRVPAPEPQGTTGRLPLLLTGRSSVGCFCVQVRWFGGYKLIWPTKRTTRLWRRWTG